MKAQGSIIASEIMEDYKREQYYKNKKKNKKKEQEAGRGRWQMSKT